MGRHKRVTFVMKLGKSTSLLKCVCVSVYTHIRTYIYGGSLVTKSCPTLATQWAVPHQAPLSMGFPRQGYCSGLPFPLPGDLLDPGIEPASSHCRRILYS